MDFIWRFFGWHKEPERDSTTNIKSGSSEKFLFQKKWSPISDILIQVLVTGQTFGSEQQFMNQVDQHLQNNRMCLRREDYDQNSDRLLLLFCPVATRVGTDINHALEKIAAGRKIILVVMHHVPNEALTLHTDCRGQIQNTTIICSVDCRFSQASGLYSSKMNTTAVMSVSSMIQKQFEKSN